MIYGYFYGILGNLNGGLLVGFPSGSHGFLRMEFEEEEENEK